MAGVMLSQKEETVSRTQAGKESGGGNRATQGFVVNTDVTLRWEQVPGPVLGMLHLLHLCGCPGCPRVGTSSRVQRLPQVSRATGGLGAALSPDFLTQHGTGQPDITTYWLKLVLGTPPRPPEKHKNRSCFCQSPVCSSETAVLSASGAGA